MFAQDSEDCAVRENWTFLFFLRHYVKPLDLFTKDVKNQTSKNKAVKKAHFTFYLTLDSSLATRGFDFRSGNQLKSKDFF